VIYTVLYSYLFGWVVTSIGFALIVRKLQHPVRLPPHPIPLVVAAGAAWPVVVLGATQMAIVAFVARSSTTRSIRKRTRALADNELDDLLDEWPSAPGTDAHCQVGT
jgi:hypothetical protein